MHNLIWNWIVNYNFEYDFYTLWYTWVIQYDGAVQSSSSFTQMWNVIWFDCEYLYSHKTFKCKTKSCVYHRNGKLGAWSSLIHMTIKVDLIAQRDGCCTFLMRFHLIIHKLLTWLHTQNLHPLLWLSKFSWVTASYYHNSHSHHAFPF